MATDRVVITTRRELAGMLADLDVKGGLGTREERLAIRLGHTSAFLAKALNRRLADPRNRVTVG